MQQNLIPDLPLEVPPSTKKKRNFKQIYICLGILPLFWTFTVCMQAAEQPRILLEISAYMDFHIQKEKKHYIYVWNTKIQSNNPQNIKYVLKFNFVSKMVNVRWTKLMATSQGITMSR